MLNNIRNNLQFMCMSQAENTTVRKGKEKIPVASLFSQFRSVVKWQR